MKKEKTVEPTFKSGNDAKPIVKRSLPLQKALIAVDDWLKSDDTWVTDAQGNKVDGGLICCKSGALLNRMIKLMGNDA